MSKQILPEKGKVKVIFHNSSAPDGKSPIAAGLNGKPMLIPRNREVILDVDWLRGVFESSVITEYATDEGGRGIAQPRDVPRFTYEIVEIIKEENMVSGSSGSSGTACGESVKASGVSGARPGKA